MADERVTILRMVSEGRLTPDQAEELLEALEPEHRPQVDSGRFAQWGPDPEEDPTWEVGSRGRSAATWNFDLSEAGRALENAIRSVADIEVVTKRLNKKRKRRRVRARRGGEPIGGAPSVEQLVELANHGVDADFIRELRTHGLNDLSMDDVIELSDHGVTPDVVHEFRVAGLEGLGADDLIELVDHGVEPELVSGLRTLGFVAFAVDDLVELCDHGVDTDFITDLHRAGVRDLRVEDLVELADHGVDPETISEFQKTFVRREDADA